MPDPGSTNRRWLLVAALLAIMPELCGAVTIYRFGGEALAPPAEANQPGVVFRQMNWADLSLLNGGQSTRVQMDGEKIGPLLHNPRKNIAPERLAGDSRLTALMDRNGETFWTAPRYDCGGGAGQSNRCEGRFGQVINIDFEDEILIDRILIISGGSGDPQFVNPVSIIKHLGIALSPEPLGASARPQPPYIVEIHDNKKQSLNISIPSYQPAAAVQIALGEHSLPWEIVEIQIYAKGVTKEASYTSNMIDFGRPAVWGEVRWSLQPEVDSNLILQTRNGALAELFRYWKYTGVGDQKVEVTKEEYDQLKRSQQGEPTTNLDSWNSWSPRFDMARGAGSPPLFPRPRRFLQFRLEFFSLGAEGTELEFLEFRASEAAVHDVVGELDPVEVEAGALTRFTYALKPRLEAGDSGFDRLVISTVAARLDSVHEVRIDGLTAPFTVDSLDEEGAAISFPRVGEELSDAVIEIVFGAQALRYGSAFTVRIADSRRPFDVGQPVLAGDAVDEMLGDRVWIETTIAVRSVLDVEVAPSVFTPNGDGVNDQVSIGYSLFETTGGVLVEVEIRDLAGRLVKQVYSGEQAIGRFEHTWDGQDDGGRQVPPGIYIYRVTTNMNDDRLVKTGTLHVVY